MTQIIALAPILLYSITIHEFFHAWAAYKLGDDTAYRMGRVSMNPLVHLDLMGTIAFILAGFGWGKPVPVNPYNFRRPERDDIIVSMAGPLSNIGSALLFALAFRAVGFMGDKEWLGGNAAASASYFFYLAVEVSVILFAFNLIPLPPLDGSHVLASLLPPAAQRWYRENSGLLTIGLFVLVITGVPFLWPIVGRIVSFLLL